MFDFVRTHNRILQIGLGLVILPLFVASGVQGYMHFFSDAQETVASVDGKAISRNEWDARHRQDVDRLRARDPSVDLKRLDTPEMKRQSLDGLIRERVLFAAEVHQDLEPSDERVTLAIRLAPELQELRDPARRAAYLAQRGMSADAFFESVKDQLGSRQVLDGVSASEILPAVAVQAGADGWFDQRAIQWQRFDVKDFAAAIAPTEAQVQAYYADKAHAKELTAPDEAKIDYVVFDVDVLKPQMSVNEADVRGFYDNNKAHYTVTEERRASHILVSVAANAAPAEVDKARARAESILAEVRKNPSAFAEIAKKESDDAGSKAQGGDLDFMSRKDAPAGAFAETLFSMKEGQVSDVVRSSAGFHILELTGVRGGTVRPFEEVRSQIEDQLRTQLAQKLYAEKADQFTNLVYEQPDALPTKIDTYTLTKQTAVVQRTAQPGATGPLASARVLGAVFATDSIQGKHNTEAVEAGTGQLVSAHVVEYHPQHMRPLAEVHDLIVQKLRQAQASVAAKKEGDARIEAARKDASLALPLTATVSRQTTDPQIPRAVIDAALKADLAKGPAVVGVALEDGGYAAVRVLKSVPRNPADPAAGQFKTQAEQAFAEAEQRAYYDALKVRYKAEVNDKRVARGEDSAASGGN